MSKLLILSLCSSMAFAAVPPKQTNGSNLSKRLAAAAEKTSAVRKNNFSKLIPAEICNDRNCDCGCDNGNETV